jgi:hypothetical protein
MRDTPGLRGFVVTTLSGRSENLTQVSAPLRRGTNGQGIAAGIPKTTTSS